MEMNLVGNWMDMKVFMYRTERNFNDGQQCCSEQTNVIMASACLKRHSPINSGQIACSKMLF